MQITEDALLEVAQSQGDDHVRRFDVELINHKRQIMTVKDVLGKQKTMISSRIDQFRPPEVSDGPYRTKIRRTKLSTFRLGVENFV